MKDILEPTVAYYDPQACDLQEFTALIDQTTSADTVPHAAAVEKNIPVYDMDDLRPSLEDPAKRRDILGEWARVLRQGAGVVALKKSYTDTTVLDEATQIYERIIAEEKEVHIHCRIGETPEDISAIRVALGECDTLIGGDLVVSAGAKTLALMATGRTKAVVNNHEVITGDFTRDTEFQIPSDRLELSLEARLKDGLTLFDAARLAEKVMGDSIYSNMIVFGACWQLGLIPVGHDAIGKAIELNGAKVADNLRAFEVGRWAALNAEKLAEALDAGVVDMPQSLDERIATRLEHLTAYQSARLATRYRKLVDGIEDARLKEAVADGYHKLLSYKDEYEVARLLQGTRAQAEEVFEGDLKVSYHLAPPMLPGKDAQGRPKKRRFGAWTDRLWPVLARMKRVRGTPLDPFGYTAERRMERRLIREYERDMKRLLASGRVDDAAVALAELPLSIRGFGPVKLANAERAAARREELWAALDGGASSGTLAAE